MSLEARQFEARLARIDSASHKISPMAGDLVRRRRQGQDKQKSRELEPSWEGPDRVNNVSPNGKSMWLED